MALEAATHQKRGGARAAINLHSPLPSAGPMRRDGSAGGAQRSRTSILGGRVARSESRVAGKTRCGG